MSTTYIKKYYGAPADIGRRVIVDGKPGIIYKECSRGAYIMVNFDHHKPGHCRPCHPTCRVDYLEMGKFRPMTRSQKRYQRFLDTSDAFNFKDFRDFLQWDERQRKNGGAK